MLSPEEKPSREMSSPQSPRLSLSPGDIDAVAKAVSARIEPRLSKLERTALNLQTSGRPKDPATGRLLSSAATPQHGGDEAEDTKEAEGVEASWGDILESDTNVSAMMKELRTALVASRDERASRREERDKKRRAGGQRSERSSRGAASPASSRGASTRASRYSHSDDGSFNARSFARSTSTDAMMALARARQEAARRAEARDLCPTFHPEGRFRKVWNVIVVILISFCAVAVPLEMGYERSLHVGMGPEGWRAWEHFNLFVDCISAQSGSNPTGRSIARSVCAAPSLSLLPPSTLPRAP